MLIGWCMGVRLETIMRAETITAQGWQKQPIKIRNEKRINRT